MTRLYRQRNNAITALATRTQITVDGEQTAPGPLQVPAEAKKLVQVIVTAMADLAATEQGNYLVRLEGPGLPAGPEAFPCGGSGVQIATGGHLAHSAEVYDVDIPVVGSNEIILTGEMLGVDVGSSELSCTLVFEA